MRRRELTVTGAIVGTVCAILALPFFEQLELISIDALHALRYQIVTASRNTSPTVVIALDEETYRTEPFANIPKVLWTPQLARVVNAAVKAGAKVVGFDVIFPTTASTYLKGFDRDFLLALRAASKNGKAVLGKVQHSEKPIAPFPAQSFAVGHHRNIRALNLVEDSDGIVRRVPLFLASETASGIRWDPSMALELALRARGLDASNDRDRLRLGDYDVPGADRNALAINFDTAPGSIPIFSLADIYACLDRGPGDFLNAHLARKVVLIGTVLDVEDRKLTSMRLATTPNPGGSAPRCALSDSARPAVGGARDTLPGVLVQAQAINNLILGQALEEFPPLPYALLALPLLILTVAAVMGMKPSSALVVVGVSAVVWVGLATTLFTGGLVLPLIDPLVGASFVYVATLGYRFAISDKDKRFLRCTFALYLAPAVVDRMVANNVRPALGGETRELTVMFSDIAKFSAISEGLAPSALLAFMNEYLSAMSDIIEAHGGFVDKYIGDAIVAVFGAPHDDPDHATHAVEAALVCHARLQSMQSDFTLPGNPVVSARIGLNTGEILVGNMGSRRRLNYTVMGDAVNLASRLEGVNKVYGTTLLASADTRSRCQSHLLFREIDRVRVVGREGGVDIYEPIGIAGEIANRGMYLITQFSEALAAYRDRQFSDAANAFEKLAADGDSASEVLAKLARQFEHDPPPLDWDAINTLESK